MISAQSTLYLPQFSVGAPADNLCTAANLDQVDYDTSSRPFPLYQCKKGGWVKLPDNDPLTNIGVQIPLGFAGTFQNAAQIDVTDAPYLAKCDGHTDDHVAIQSAINDACGKDFGGFDSGIPAIVNLPFSSTGKVFQCDIGTVGLIIPDICSIRFESNGSYLGYRGSGRALFLNSPDEELFFFDDSELLIDMNNATGTPTGLATDGAIVFLPLGVDIEGGPPGYFAFDFNDYTTPFITGGFTDGLVKMDTPRGGFLSNMSFYPNPKGLPANNIGMYINNPIYLQLIQDVMFYDGSDGPTSQTLCTVKLENTSLENPPPLTFYDVQLHASGSTDFLCLGAGLGMVNGTINAYDSGATHFLSGTPTPGDLKFLEQAGGFTFYLNGIAYSGLSYSAAGVRLPTCNVSTVRAKATVSDATTPTYLGTYASGGAVVAPVMCNGTNWVTY